MSASPKTKMMAERTHGGRMSSLVGPTGGGGPAVRADTSRLTAAPTASAESRRTRSRTDGRGRRVRCAIGSGCSAGPRLTPSGGGGTGDHLSGGRGGQQVEAAPLVVHADDHEIIDGVPEVR